MFGNNSKSGSGINSASGKRGGFSVIGPDMIVTGNVVATADIHLDGRVDGDIRCGALVQSGDGHVAGSVTADNARIAGTIDGEVSVRDLTVERGARISGDVSYETISIETGAQVDGKLKRIVGSGEPLPDAPLILEARPEGPPRLFSAGAAA
jgi:cytoskeletal protein CcmA (bactofilin family)